MLVRLQANPVSLKARGPHCSSQSGLLSVYLLTYIKEASGILGEVKEKKIPETLRWLVGQMGDIKTGVMMDVSSTY